MRRSTNRIARLIVVAVVAVVASISVLLLLVVLPRPVFNHLTVMERESRQPVNRPPAHLVRVVIGQDGLHRLRHGLRVHMVDNPPPRVDAHPGVCPELVPGEEFL